MADETGTPEAGAETTEAPQIDFSGINEQLEKQDAKLSSFIEQFSSQQQTEPDEPDDYIDPSYYEALGLQPPDQPQDDSAALHALARLGDERAQRVIEQNVSPEIQQMRAELQNFRVERDLQQLKAELPKLNEPEVAEQVAQIVEDNLQGLPPEARMNPNIVRLAYRAWEADQMAAGEGSADKQHPELEHAGGAGPEGSDMTWNDALRQNAAPSKGAAFWGFNGI